MVRAPSPNLSNLFGVIQHSISHSPKKTTLEYIARTQKRLFLEKITTKNSVPHLPFGKCLPNVSLSKYNASPLPPAKIAQNVLAEMGVPQSRTESVLELILESAEKYGFTKKIKEKTFIDLSSKLKPSSPSTSVAEDSEDLDSDPDLGTAFEESPNTSPPLPHPKHDERLRRVFITHGKNQAFIGMIKKLLAFGELTPVVSVENQSVSKPVPDKVMDDMRSCGAAIIHVDSEQKLIDENANEVNTINGNVLIEIGAAIALYGRRYILLVREGVKLPSNLQGLYVVRYGTDDLSGEATIKLLEAINDIKNQPLPTAQ